MAIFPLVDKQSRRIGRFEVILETREDKGEKFQYSYVSMFDSVCVLPILNNKVIFERQYRYALNEWMYEIPGGMVDEHELPIVAAKRELLEETGYLAEELIPLNFYYPSPGSSTEKAWLFAANCTKSVKTNLEPLENIEICEFDFEEVERMVSTGVIKHSMTIIAWSRYKNYLRGIRYVD